jgi:hypothetical protein
MIRRATLVGTEGPFARTRPMLEFLLVAETLILGDVQSGRQRRWQILRMAYVDRPNNSKGVGAEPNDMSSKIKLPCKVAFKTGVKCREVLMSRCWLCSWPARSKRPAAGGSLAGIGRVVTSHAFSAANFLNNTVRASQHGSTRTARRDASLDANLSRLEAKRVCRLRGC